MRTLIKAHGSDIDINGDDYAAVSYTHLILRQIADWAGFEIIGRIPLREKSTGKEFR